MFASSRVRENVAISLVFTSRQRSLPFCELRERCKPERPKNDQNRARCWLPQHAQQGQKKVSKIISKRFQNRPRELQNHSPELPKSSRGAPQSSELPRTSKERPRSPQISQQSPSSSQGLSKVRPKGLRGTLWEALWGDLGLQIEVSEPMLAHFLS